MSDPLPDSAEGCATLVDLLRWRALHQPDQSIYTYLLDGEAAEARLTYHALESVC